MFKAEKPDGTMRKLSDVEKLNALGWNKKISLKDGISGVYDWYLKEKN